MRNTFTHSPLLHSKGKRKIISLLICAAMVLSLFGNVMSVAATGYEAQSETEQSKFVASSEATGTAAEDSSEGKATSLLEGIGQSTQKVASTNAKKALAQTRVGILATTYDSSANATVSNPADLASEVANAPNGTPWVIEVSSSMTLSAKITIPNAKNITIRSSQGSTFTLTSPTVASRHFEVAGTGRLTLENIVLDGASRSGGVFVNGADAALTMEDGAVIKNCLFAAASDERGAVRVDFGRFTMNGGTIQNNETLVNNFMALRYSDGGGGVWMEGGTFLMTGGLIDSNQAKNGGGLNIRDGAAFTMSGGTISKNTSTVNYAGGVLVGSNSSFTMDGGLIEGNTSANYGGGVIGYISAALTMNGGQIRANTGKKGGGVCVYGATTFTMNGGVIGGSSSADANHATTAGGGVFLNDDNNYSPGPLFTMNNDALIKCNTSLAGAGVYAYSVEEGARFVMNDTSLITENVASSAGGGVYVAGNNIGTMEMNNQSSITNNKTLARYGKGGGGAIVESGSLTMNDESSVHDNTSAHNGGGLGVYHDDALLTMNGNSSIYNNTAQNDGGGAYVSNRAYMVMNSMGAIVHDNKALENGGGIYVCPDATGTIGLTCLIINNGIIEDNTALGGLNRDSGGGGIYFQAEDGYRARLDISGTSIIRNNTAPNGHGGGIHCYVKWLEDSAGNPDNDVPTHPNWGQMNIGPGVIFTGNDASVLYVPAEDVFVLYPSIEFASISVGGLVPRHSLNNFDINYFGTATPIYKVTYYPNGATSGTPPARKYYVEGATVTISDKNTLERTDYDFVNWNLEPTGDDVAYEPGDTFIMPAHDVDLYAQWTPSPGPGDPDPEPDPEEFYKMPTKTKVVPGEEVTYKIASFTNPVNHAVNKYAITDLPPKDLTFVKGSVPAFTKGDGLTYSIKYRTNKGGSKTLESGISASSPHTFSAPKLANGEYLTAIAITFEKVPAGFGKGDVIVFTFKVSDNPSSKKIVNKSNLSYEDGGEEVRIPGGETPVTVVKKSSGGSGGSSRSTNSATGDPRTMPLWAAGVTSIAAAVILRVTQRRKNHRSSL